MDKVYELGQYIGNGASSYFFALREPGLGVKIRRCDPEVAKELLLAELVKAKQLRDIGVLVPNFVGIVRVRIPSHIEKTLDRAAKRFSELKEEDWRFLNDKEEITSRKDTLTWGLAMQIVENDLTLVSADRVAYHYYQERERLTRLGIRVEDSGSDHNVLWSKKEAKLYFIDFDDWYIPKVPGTVEKREIPKDETPWWMRMLRKIA